MKTITLLIYMASDNDLAIYAEEDVAKIIESSYYSDMTIVVQYKKSLSNTPTLRVVIQKGEIVIDNMELQKALDVSVKIDVLGFDACFMGMFEIVYQLRNQAKVVVASQHLEPARGWDYRRILEELDVSGTAVNMGKKFIAFHDEYHNGKEKAEITQSALDTSVIDEVSKNLDKFSEVLRKELKKNDVLQNRKELEITLENSQFFGRTDYVDLVGFINKVKNRFELDVLLPYADELLASLKALIIANHNIGGFMKEANGISIYFPYENRPCEETFLMYEKLDFSLEHSNWIGLLKWYWLEE